MAVVYALTSIEDAAYAANVTLRKCGNMIVRLNGDVVFADNIIVYNDACGKTLAAEVDGDLFAVSFVNGILTVEYRLFCESDNDSQFGKLEMLA